MQFMSQSMGWADNIVLAMAPLGIITAVVGAIRVGGPSWLKALIGRARESRAIAESELMSSTSHEVCELWNGQQIVRVMGEGPIREFILLFPKGDAEDRVEVIRPGHEQKYLKEHGEWVTSIHLFCGVYLTPRSFFSRQNPHFGNTPPESLFAMRMRRLVVPKILTIVGLWSYSETDISRRRISLSTSSAN